MRSVSFKKIVSAALAAAVTFTGSISAPIDLFSANAEDVMKYEFEEAKAEKDKLAEAVKPLLA